MRVFIVDDQEIERFHMRVLFKHCPDITVVGESGKLKEAAQLINACQPDAIFLDIDLGKKVSGFDLLPLIETEAKIVFVTLYNEYAVRAFRVNALDYLKKPVTIERLAETLVRINQELIHSVPQDEQILKKQDLIHLKGRGRQALIPLACVVAIVADGDYTYSYTSDDDVFYMRRSMKEWLRILPSELFASLDRTLIIGVENLREIRAENSAGGTLIMNGTTHNFVLGKTALKEGRRLMKKVSSQER